MYTEVDYRETIKDKSNSLLTQAATNKQEFLRGAALYAFILSDYIEKDDKQTYILNQTI